MVRTSGTAAYLWARDPNLLARKGRKCPDYAQYDCSTNTLRDWLVHANRHSSMGKNGVNGSWHPAVRDLAKLRAVSGSTSQDIKPWTVNSKPSQGLQPQTGSMEQSQRCSDHALLASLLTSCYSNGSTVSSCIHLKRIQARWQQGQRHLG